MFRNRRSSQKPDEELYAAFKQNFPDVGSGTSNSAGPGQGPIPGPTLPSSTLGEALIDASTSQRPFDNTEEAKAQDATPRAFQDTWRLTPSLMDPNSFAFAAFANQPPGYYTPTPGGFNTLYHSQAGDLHTPGMGMNTPLSLPHSVHALHAPDPLMHLQHFNPHLLHHAHPFHDPFHQAQQQAQQQAPPQPTYAPSQFLQHQDSGYAALDDTTPNKTTPNQNEMTMPPPTMAQMASQQAFADMTGMPSMVSGEKFRFHTTLNAPTAMIRHTDEIPITYLNKGQAYTMSIFDTSPPLLQQNMPVQYRTYVRVSFEDEQQRARPAACWQLWKEGRGSNEAHQRGGKLLAVEYVDPNQGGDDDLRKSQIQLETASFDGFAVTWYPNRATGGPDCSLSVRFNFLSTDFSHSKGVKGIPVRLCAKTELLTPHGGASNGPEVCFSKVKLFRDHGAERKLSNDVAHVKKTIDKLKQQIAQAESGMGNVGKRKRSGSIAKASGSGPGKVMKHKRTWSVDSDAETGRISAEEDLHVKLVGLQDMFSSTRPISVLYLRGEPEDDPDLHPVKLSGEGTEPKALTRTTTWESRQSTSASPSNSPSMSSASQTTPKRKFSEIQESAILEEPEPDAETALIGSPTSRLTKVSKFEDESSQNPNLIAVDVDKTYQPPTEPIIKPVACFYIRQKGSNTSYYRAVYLMHRTVKDLVNRIAEKFSIDSHRITQVTHVNAKGLHIVVDEDVVREVPEGQDMIVEFAPVQQERPVKPEYLQPAVTEMMVDGDIAPGDITISDPLEMWLNY